MLSTPQQVDENHKQNHLRIVPYVTSLYYEEKIAQEYYCRIIIASSLRDILKDEPMTDENLIRESVRLMAEFAFYRNEEEQNKHRHHLTLLRLQSLSNDYKITKIEYTLAKVVAEFFDITDNGASLEKRKKMLDKVREIWINANHKFKN
jgi:hypothetical protein